MTVPCEAHELETTEQYPAAIDVLEHALQADPFDPELAIRLGFNLWYAVAEELRMGAALPVDKYAERFMALFREHESRLRDNADFCWAFGLGMSLFWYMFPGATQKLGDELLGRARKLNPFWARFSEGKVSQEELAERFRNRGIWASYYEVQ